MDPTRNYFLYASGENGQAQTDRKGYTARTQTPKSRARLPTKGAYDIYPQKKGTTRSSFVAPPQEQQEPVSPIPHAQSPGTFLWNETTPRAPSYGDTVQLHTSALANQPANSAGGGEATRQRGISPKKPPSSTSTSSPDHREAYAAPLLERSPPDEPSDHYSDKLERLRALLASPPRRADVTDTSEVQQWSAGDGGDDEAPRPLRLWWEQQTSGNVLISSEGDRCVADLSEARRVMETQAPHRATADLLRRFRFPMFAFGNLGIVEGEMHFAVQIEAAGLERGTAAAVSLAVGVASAPSGEDASDICGYVFNSDRTISLMRTTDEAQRARYGAAFGVGDCIGVHVDLTKRCLSFSVNEVAQGGAFEFIPTERPQPLFPFVFFRQEGDMVAFVPATA